MKKYKNIVIGGIENKVFNLILGTIILIAALFVVVNLYQNSILKEVSAEGNQKQQEALTETTNAIMGQVVDQSMSKTTNLEARIADEFFHSLTVRVQMMGQYAQKLFDEPETAGRGDIEGPNPADKGKVVPQLILANGVEREEIDDKIGLAAKKSVAEHRPVLLSEI